MSVVTHLVAGPNPSALEEAVYFHRRLTEKGMPFVAFLVNRVHGDPGRGLPPRKGRPATVSPALAVKISATFREQQVLAAVERRALARLEVDTRERPVPVPEIEQDVHDLRALAELGERAFERRKTRRVRAVAS